MYRIAVVESAPMTGPRIRILLLLTTIVLVSACGTTDPPYYVFAITRGLQHDGFLVAVEKRDCEQIGAPRLRSDDPRFRVLAGANADVLNEEFLARTDDDEALFVSQIYETVPTPDGRWASYDLYNAHDPNGDGIFADSVLRNGQDAYEHGYHQLDRLGRRIRAKLDAGTHTHVVVMAMGWHNDQIESVARYNAILKNLKSAAKPDRFEPLVVGITWPSAWASASTNYLVEKAGHLASYFNKARDADELGFTIGAWLLHQVVMPHTGGTPTILIGHSLGARILARSLYSRGHLASPVTEALPDLLLGLQPAMSVRRFLARPDEPEPFAHHATLPTRVVMTSSEHDSANHVARFVTGARHAGGKYGLATAREHSDVFATPTWEDLRARPDWTFTAGQITLVDASSIVRSDRERDVWGRPVSAHNDILDLQMGELGWFFISRVPGRPAD